MSYLKQYRADNKEHIQEQRKQFYEDNKEHIQEQRKLYRVTNKEHIIEQNKQYCEDNKELIQKRTKQYKIDNKEHIQEQRKLYNEANKEHIQKRQQLYKKTNKEHIQEQRKLYNENNKDKILNRIPKCKTNLCNTQVRINVNEGYCLRCFIHTYPEKPVARNYKTKEKSVADFVLLKYPNFTWNCDKKITDGCSKRRPDLLADFGYFIIIIEIDENQHTTYDTTCENKRLMELSQDVGHRPIVFIRFNPDDYIVDNDKFTSCWGIDGNGICVVKKSKINEWNCRLITLIENIDFWSNPDNKTEKTIEQIHLFYDVDTPKPSCF